MKQKQVDDWVKNYKGGVYLLDKNDNIYVNFGRHVGAEIKKYDSINTFILPRKSFKTRAPKICGYSNYFFEYYGSKRFLQNLFMIKILVDDRDKRLKTKTFIELMKKYLITEDLQKLIIQMVDDNYLNILDKNNPILNKNDTDNSSDDYFKYQIISDKNGKRIMCSVIAINLIYPLVAHYTHVRKKKNDDLYQYFSPFLDMFSTNRIDNIQKLSMYTWSVLSIHYSRNKSLWKHREVMGDMNKEEFYDRCFRKYIITDSLPWLVFDNNMGSFFNKILQEQLNYYIKGEYELMPVELKTEKTNDEGFSEMEKFESQLSKVDEGLVILSETNVRSVIDAIKSRFNMELSDDELDYYVENIHFSKDQHIMINYHFAKYFNGYRDLKLIDKATFVELAVIMKIRLLAQGMVYLPYILTGNLKKKGAANKLHVNKVLNKVIKSKYYNEILIDKFGFIVDSKTQNPILKLLRSILVSTYTYVDYYNPDMNGSDIEVDAETLIYEFLQFIDQI